MKYGRHAGATPAPTPARPQWGREQTVRYAHNTCPR